MCSNSIQFFLLRHCNIKLKLFNVLLSKILTFPAWTAFRAEFCSAKLLVVSLANCTNLFSDFLKLWTSSFQINVFPLWSLADTFVSTEVLLSSIPLYFPPWYFSLGKQKHLSLLVLFPRTEKWEKWEWWELVIIWSWQAGNVIYRWEFLTWAQGMCHWQAWSRGDILVSSLKLEKRESSQWMGWYEYLPAFGIISQTLIHPIKLLHTGSSERVHNEGKIKLHSFLQSKVFPQGKANWKN